MAESDMLSALLNDPHALEQALSTASALLGGSDPPAMPSMSEPSGMPSASPSASANDAYDPSADLMRRAMPVLGRIAQRGQAAVTPQKRALLNAVKPFVGAPHPLADRPRHASGLAGLHGDRRLRLAR